MSEPREGRPPATSDGFGEGSVGSLACDSVQVLGTEKGIERRGIIIISCVFLLKLSIIMSVMCYS
jgi:hypothetical protein